PIGRLEIGERVGQALSKTDGVKKFPTDIMTGSYFKEPEKASDVIIIGGGTGGAIAAIASGRQGVKTTLIEASPSLGGIGTGGAIHIYCAGTRGGIQDEMDNKIAEISQLFLGKWKVVGFHPEAKKTILQQMAESAGVDIILNTVISGVIREKGKYQTKSDEKVTTKAIAIPEPYEEINRLLGVIAVGSNGVSIYRAKVFIDSTGDGDIAAMSGAPFVIGRERDNLTHTFSQPAEGLNKEGNLYGLNFDAGYVDPTDVEDLTRGRRLGISLYWHDKFDAGNRILHIAPIIGIRQSRQIIGEYQLTLADEIAGRKFEDGISFMTTFYDNHGFDYENESDEAALWVWALGNFSRRIGCEVPYRCMIPKNVDGLILACRAISLTFDAHAGMRMQNDIQRIGEVAGLAGAMAVKDGVPVREIDIKKLQAMLKESGILDEKYRPAPAVEDRPLELPAGTEIDESKTEALVWLSTYKGKETALALKNLINSEDPNMRFRASAALAKYGVEEAFQELLRSVKERVNDKTKGAKSVAIWEASIPFLGMTGDKRAVPALIEILKDKNATLDALIGALRALERIGDKSVVSDIQEFLKRDDLPTKRVLQSSSALLKDMSPAVDDARWQIELAAAETLLSLDVPLDNVRKIVEPHLKDNRVYVRRYANKILSI
ncbi:MAG: FAD-dependent oxidoreductase, partial [Candidatus Poribacteria bacterium]